ncbi:MAG: pyridoxamine 5'-phosphate oxidase family protein [Ilumatobacteraceae bacterium]|jgi:nitroimidazol reductase NimA-like FMN-containing flavoprotein (pyridoxamine 5'-phosphate oxidase superfamily)
MRIDRQGMSVLAEDQCFELLDTMQLGRIALTERALPSVLPVRYARLGDGSLLFRVGDGTILRAARMGQIVCFEADSGDHELRGAWSVTAIGQLTVVDQPDMLEEAGRIDLVPWSQWSNTFVRLAPEVVNGRRLEPID